MIGRRALLLAALPIAAARAAVLGDDGLWHEDWFVESFLDLRDDLAAARDAGRRLAVFWELRGCPFCARMHREVLSDPSVVAAVKPHFDIVQLDVIGARTVTFPDGVALAEKAQAARRGVVGTPTLMVFDEAGAEAGRLEGFVPKADFLAFFRNLRRLA